jgi:hypothetical protein
MGGKNRTRSRAVGRMKSGREIQGNIQVGIPFLLGDPRYDPSFSRSWRRSCAQSQDAVDDDSRASRFKKSRRFGGPDQRFFPKFGFYPRIRVDSATGGTGQEELHLPAGLLKFQTDEDSVIPVMSWPDQNQGVAGSG